MLKTIKLYETPDMKVFEMHTEGVMCTSPYGEANKAGVTLNENGEYEYDF